MITRRADVIFYPSPTMAMQALHEGLAYVANIDSNGDGRADAPAAVVAHDGGPHEKELRERITLERIYLVNPPTTRATPAIDVAEQWRRAVQGDAEARRRLLERIMSRRAE